jgi:hypothetical protein
MTRALFPGAMPSVAIKGDLADAGTAVATAVAVSFRLVLNDCVLAVVALQIHRHRRCKFENLSIGLLDRWHVPSTTSDVNWLFRRY